MFAENPASSVFRLFLLIVLIVGISGMEPIHPVLAATQVVTNTNDSGAGSLRQIIADAASGSTITFYSSLAGQTIVLLSALVIDKDLTIDASALSQNISINGASAPDVIMVIGPNNDPTVSLKSIDFLDAPQQAILQFSGALEVSDCNFSGNSNGIQSETQLSITNSGFVENAVGIVTFGIFQVDSSIFENNNLGIYNEKVWGFSLLGQATIINSIFMLNQGGGIQNRNGSLTIVNSVFLNNASDYGGAVIGEATISDSLFENNSASEYGGAINGSPLLIINTTFLNNTAGKEGGAFFGDGEITDSTFIGNSSGEAGGGISARLQVLLSDSTFINNEATTNGGAIYHHQTTTLLVSEVKNNSFFQNFAGGKGGGIFNDSNLLLTNNTFSENSANSGGNLYNANGRTLSGGTYKASDLQMHNTILANSPSGTDCYNEANTTINATNNLIENNSGGSNNCGTPIASTDPSLGPLVNNGGFTQTMALGASSPAIDAGEDASCPATDQRGITRPQGSHCDIGAYEVTFTDVPSSHPYSTDIEILYANGLTAGCVTTPLKFCPDQIMDRAQSAVFMLRGSLGATYQPLVTPSHIFADNWSPGPWAEKWAEGMFNAGLTAGCTTSGSLKFCPWEQMPREQVVIFGLRLKYGNAYTPPPATGTLFADMMDPNYYATKWAEQAYLDGLIPSCGTSGGKPKFCPQELVTRGLGAYIIVRARDLSMP